MEDSKLGFLKFTRKCLGYLWVERYLAFMFILTALVAAVTEGVTVSMLVPILDTHNGSSAFSKIPVLGDIAALLDAGDYIGTLKRAALLLAIALLLRGALQYLVQVFAITIQMRLRNIITQRAYDALMTVKTSYINEIDVGTLQNNITTLPHRVTVLLKYFMDMIWNGLLVIIYIILMLVISVEMTIYAAILVVVLSLGLRWFTTGPLRVAGKIRSESQAKTNHVAYETFNGFSLIRLAVAEGIMIEKFRTAFGKMMVASRNVQLFGAIPSPMLATAAGIFICFLLYTAATFNTGKPDDWIPLLLLFIFLLSRILSPVTALNTARTNMQGDMHAFETLESFFSDAITHKQPNGSRKIQSLEKSIELRAVDFSYHANDGPALHNVSTIIKKGEMVAVVGPSGAGKSTLVNLLVRLYDPQNGGIYIDGEDLREFDVFDWRNKISVVSQHTIIFNDSVASNIAFGQSDIDFENIERAAKMAMADDFIRALPQGYDTLLGDRGTRLSGGQQQRIAIARAILADPEFLILDEATSSLDSVTENAIREAIDHFGKERTTLVIAHRLSTIQKADRIIVMKDGRIAEEGNHVSLAQKGGVYAELLKYQQLGIVNEKIRSNRIVD